MFTVSLAFLFEKGLSLEAHEAVAIAQSVASAPGIPTITNVEVRSDGSAICIVRSGTATAKDAAAFLDALVSAHGHDVPPALRYTIARGVGAVEAPAFESPAAFSAVLNRFEAGDRRVVIRDVLQRAARLRPSPPPAASVSPVMAPRPRPHAIPRVRPSPAPLEPAGRGIIFHTDEPDRPPRRHRWGLVAATALLASGIVGFAAVRFARPGPDSPVAQLAGVGTTGTTPSSAGAALPLRASQPVRVLGDRDAPAFSPAFSPSGTALFFQTGGRNDRSSAIAVASASEWPGGDLRIVNIVDDGSRNYHAHPSPDGESIAFDSDRDGERGVYVANRDGSGVRRISGPGYAALPSWSPDGTRLAYVRGETSRPSVWNLWVQPVDGGAPRRITKYPYGQTWSASWFPDSVRIAYTHEATLTIVDLETGRTQEFASPVADALLRTPAVSPDGSKIVLQVFRNGAWLLNLADGSMRCVLSDPTAEEFAWAPDGARIAFHSKRDGRWSIYLLSRG